MRLGDFMADSAASGDGGKSAVSAAAPLVRSPSPPWTVRGTKKGGLPVSVETRRTGRVVVISNVGGDLDALLTDVKRALGTGGVARHGGGYVEVQGGHHEGTVRSFLLRSGRLVGVSRGAISAASEKRRAKDSGGPDGKAALNAKAAPPPSEPAPVETAEVPDAKKIKSMKPPELRAHLQARGLSTQGNRKELIARLLAVKDSS